MGAPESGVVGRRRLDTAHVIGTPRLEHGLSTVPRPGELKAGERDSKRRLREVREIGRVAGPGLPLRWTHGIGRSPASSR